MARREQSSNDRRLPPSPLRFSVALCVALAAFNPFRTARADPDTDCDIARVVAAALPATVNIRVVKVVKTDQEDGAGSETRQIEVAYGSGVIVDPSGLIVTNKHVIKDAALVTVTFADREQADAQLVGAATLFDLAILKVNRPEPLPALKFANSEALRIGQPDIAVGNPLGLGTSVSSGVVSALHRDLMRSPFDDFIQTDATINPGNSGGALLNCDGKIIGINTALVSNNDLLGSIGLGFALPANNVRLVFQRMLGSATVAPTWVGLHVQDLTRRLAATFGWPNLDGALVTAVDPDSPASRAGIAAGDIVTTIDGDEMSNSRAILWTIVTHPPGQRFALSVYRDGKTRDVTVTGQPWPHLMELHGNVLASPESVAYAQSLGVGLDLVPMTPADRQRLGVPDHRGVLIEHVTPGSQAATLGLTAGEAIEQVNDHPVTAIDDVPTRYGPGDPETGGMVAILVRGPSRTRWVSLFVGHLDVADLLAPPLAIPGRAPVVGDAATVAR